MIDELTIYNLSVKYPNTIDLVREVERMARADGIDEFFKKLESVAFGNRKGLVHFKDIIRIREYLKEQSNDNYTGKR